MWFELEIEEPSVLLRISRSYREGMSSDEVYEVTRGDWLIDERRDQAEYAFAVYGGVVKEVFKIDRWHFAGNRRWRFDGKVAPDAIRDKYLGEIVNHRERSPVKFSFDTPYQKPSEESFRSQDARITEPSVLFRISRSYREGMSSDEVYEVTRGDWLIDERRDQAEYAFAVYGGVVKEVFKIDRWHFAGNRRWRFDGKVVPKEIRDKYLGKSVNHRERSPVKFTDSVSDVYLNENAVSARRTVGASKKCVIMFRISRSYREGMSPLELYEATRGAWRIDGPVEESVFAVYNGVVKEVYSIDAWHGSGVLHYETRPCMHCGDPNGIGASDCLEFSGEVADDAIRDKYLGETVNHRERSPVKLTWV